MKAPYPFVAAALLALASLSAQKTPSCGSRVELSRIWAHVRAAHDADGDGRITVAEYGRGTTRFQNYDRDGDGVLTATDFPGGVHWNGFAPGFVARADRDRDGRVTGDEWRAVIARLDPDHDGVITMGEFGEMAPKQITAKPDIVYLMFDSDLDGKLEVADLESMFGDLDADHDGIVGGKELRRRRNPWPRGERGRPRPGQAAPDFELPLCSDPSTAVRLSSFRGQRPVALIFGSYT